MGKTCVVFCDGAESVFSPDRRALKSSYGGRDRQTDRQREEEELQSERSCYGGGGAAVVIHGWFSVGASWE